MHLHDLWGTYPIMHNVDARISSLLFMWPSRLVQQPMQQAGMSMWCGAVAHSETKFFVLEKTVDLKPGEANDDIRVNALVLMERSLAGYLSTIQAVQIHR